MKSPNGHRWPLHLRLTITLCMAVAPLLSGFSSTATFEAPTEQGGGDGYFYTGSHTAHGMTCANCHQGAVQTAGIKLWSEPAGLFAGGYIAGITYVVHLALERETRGLDRQGACTPGMGGCNRNSFVAEVQDKSGATAGALCVDGAAIVDGACDSDVGDETLLLANGGAVGGNSQRKPVICNGTVIADCVDIAAMKAAGKPDSEISAALVAAVRGRVSWRFLWRPPLGASEPMHLYLGVVDGDGGNSVDPHHNDYQGDAVMMVHRVIRAVGDVPPVVAGCAAGGSLRTHGRGTATMLGTLLLALWLGGALIWRRRRT